MPVEVRRTPEGAVVLVDGEVRATFVGDLGRADARAALDELVKELFGGIAQESRQATDGA